MPDSVRAVDAWLDGMENDQPEQVVRWSHPADRTLVAEGLADRVDQPTSLLALALPPKPIEHFFIGIAHKSEDGTRHVVSTELTLKNPLPFASEKVGQKLEGIPKTRTLMKRFLSVQMPSGAWRVKLDLPAVVARAELIERFQHALDAERYHDAEALLDEVPPPPDDPDALTQADRLNETLRAELEKARSRRTQTSTSAEDPQGGSEVGTE